MMIGNDVTQQKKNAGNKHFPQAEVTFSFKIFQCVLGVISTVYETRNFCQMLKSGHYRWFFLKLPDKEKLTTQLIMSSEGDSEFSIGLLTI